MKTIVVTLDKEYPDGEAILRAGEIIKAGGLVAFPTETVYGLGGDALNPESSRKIYAGKIFTKSRIRCRRSQNVWQRAFGRAP